MIAYILFGEVNVGRKRAARLKEVSANLQALAQRVGPDGTQVAERYQALFRVGQPITGLQPVAGNSGTLLADSNSAIRQMVTDIDAAREAVHLLFISGCPDNNGCAVVAALQSRGSRVTVRAMADAPGSRLMINSSHWRAMAESGVHLATALPIGNPLLRAWRGASIPAQSPQDRVIDNSITCGSQNCADRNFVSRRSMHLGGCDDAFRRPIAAQNQFLLPGTGWAMSTRTSARPCSGGNASPHRLRRPGGRHRPYGALFGHARAVPPIMYAPAGNC